MDWRDLLKDRESATIVLPWLGGWSLRSGSRGWHLEGSLPAEHGWQEFSLDGRKAKFLRGCDPDPASVSYKITGYLVGDRMVAATSLINPDPQHLAGQTQRVHLIEPGLDHFALVSAGRTHEDGPLVFLQQEMPLGPEESCLAALLDRKPDVADVKGVTPALDAAFRMACWQRAEAERRRADILEQQRLAEEKRQLEERRRELLSSLGDGAGRRAIATVDFEAAARAALAVGGAEYSDHRASAQRNEMVVRFKIPQLRGRRFECTCDRNTLQIIDSGICLTAHGYDDDEDGDGFRAGTKGDTWFTLESLPSVIMEAEREGKLVVYRHV